MLTFSYRSSLPNLSEIGKPWNLTMIQVQLRPIFEVGRSPPRPRLGILTHRGNGDLSRQNIKSKALYVTPSRIPQATNNCVCQSICLPDCLLACPSIRQSPGINDLIYKSSLLFLSSSASFPRRSLKFRCGLTAHE